MQTKDLKEINNIFEDIRRAVNTAAGEEVITECDPRDSYAKKIARLSENEETLPFLFDAVVEDDNAETPDVSYHVNEEGTGVFSFRLSRGVAGLNGAPGKDGKDGKDGRDGIDGVDGEKGDKGDPGEDGKDGNRFKFIYLALPDTTIDVAAPIYNPDKDGDLPYFNGVQWTEEPSGVSIAKQIEYVSQSEFTAAGWSKWSYPAVWARWSKDGEPGKKGKDGIGRSIFIYTSTDTIDSPETPQGGSWDPETNIVTAPEGWFDNVPEERKKYLWLSNAFFANDGITIESWTVPTRLTGEKGEDGVDGDNLEFIYRLLPNRDAYIALREYINDGHPLTSGATLEVPAVNDDLGIDSKWTNNPSGIDGGNYLIEVVCSRTKKNDAWSEWSLPTYWSMWGEDGMDGAGVEYIFRITSEEFTSDMLLAEFEQHDIYNHPDYQKDNFYPGGNWGVELDWTDEPSDVSETEPIEWVCIRKKIDSEDPLKKTWGEFSEPKIWAKYAKDGYAFKTSYVFTRAILQPEQPHGGTYNEPYPTILGADGVTIQKDPIWSDTVPAGLGEIYMTYRTFYSGPEIVDEDWSTPIKMTDTAGFQVEYSTRTEKPAIGSLQPYYENYVNGVDTREYEIVWREDNTAWSDDGTDAVWMATSVLKGGKWTDWSVVKVKGEQGDAGKNGTSIEIKGTAIEVFDALPDTLLIDEAGNEIHYVLFKDWIYKFNPETDTYEKFIAEEVGDGFVVNRDFWIWDGYRWYNAGEIKGADGESAWFIVKFSDDKIEFTEDNGTIPGRYIGVLFGVGAMDENYVNTASNYDWTLWSGDDGWGWEQIFLLTAKDSGYNENNPPAIPTDNTKVLDHVPEGWTDTPSSVSANFPYCWSAKRKASRSEIEDWKGDPEKPGYASLYTRYAYDGITAFHLELTNDQIVVPVEKDGSIDTDFTEASTRMILYSGDTVVEPTDENPILYTVSAGTVNDGDVTLTREDLKDISTVTCKATYNGTDFYKTLHVVKTDTAYDITVNRAVLIRGEDGYFINGDKELIVNILRWNADHWYGIDNQDFNVSITHLDGTVDTDESYITVNGKATITLSDEKDVRSIKIYFIKNGIEYFEEVGVVADGKDGISLSTIVEWYKVSDDKITHPTIPSDLTEESILNAGWSKTWPELTIDNPYLWNFETIVYTNGVIELVKPQVVATFVKDGLGIVNIIDYYSVGNDDINAPSGYGINPTGNWTTDRRSLTVKDKQYLWCFEVIEWTDGTKTYTDPMPVYYKAEDGKPGESVFVLDLSNDSDTVIANSEGKILENMPSTTATLYYGTEKIESGVDYTATVTGGTLDNNGVGVTEYTVTGGSATFKFKTITAEKAVMIIKATYAGVDFIKEFTVARFIGTVDYRLRTSVSSINTSEGTDKELTITTSKFDHTDRKVSQCVFDNTVKVVAKNEGGNSIELTQYLSSDKKEYNVPYSIVVNYPIFALYVEDVEWATRQIAVTKDGDNGDNVIALALSTVNGTFAFSRNNWLDGANKITSKIQVFDGLIDITNKCKYSYTASEGLSVSIVGDTITIQPGAIKVEAAVHEVVITAKYNNIELYKTITVICSAPSGESAVSVDLTNEVAQLVAVNNIVVDKTDISTEFNGYYGASPCDSIELISVGINGAEKINEVTVSNNNLIVGYSLLESWGRVVSLNTLIIYLTFKIKFAGTREVTRIVEWKVKKVDSYAQLQVTPNAIKSSDASKVVSIFVRSGKHEWDRESLIPEGFKVYANNVELSGSNSYTYNVNETTTFELRYNNEVWDSETVPYLIDGKNGNTPYIKDGYWYIGTENTGIKATGENGITPEIGDNGNWWIGDTDTGTPVTGVGVESVDVEYAISDSNTEAPVDGWASQVTGSVAGKFVWSRTKIVYSNNSAPKYSKPACISGDTGVSIESITEMYYLSTSSTELTGGTWEPSYNPDFDDNLFIWTKTIITLSDGTTTETEPIRSSGLRGATGDSGETPVIYTLIASSNVVFYNSAGELIKPTAITLTVIKTVGTVATQVHSLNSEGLKLIINNGGSLSSQTNLVIGANTITDYARIYLCPSTATNTNYSLNFKSYVEIEAVYNEKGEDGKQGPSGPVIYPAGTFDSAKTYTGTNKKAPYVFFNSDNESDKGYYIAYGTPPQGNDPVDDLITDPDWSKVPDNGGWVKMETYNAIYSDIGVFGHALVGKWVFYEDYMFSQIGTLDGVESDTYEEFYINNWLPENDVNYDGDTDGRFIPNIVMNARTGAAWFAGKRVKFGADGQVILNDATINVDKQILGRNVSFHVGEDGFLVEDSSSTGKYTAKITASGDGIVLGSYSLNGGAEIKLDSNGVSIGDLSVTNGGLSYKSDAKELIINPSTVSVSDIAGTVGIMPENGAECLYINPTITKLSSGRWMGVLVENSEMPFKTNRGVFAGLRPNVRKVSTSYTLDEFDHTIIASGSSTVLTLPSSPRQGQEYWLVCTDGNIQIKSKIYNIFNMHGYNGSLISQVGDAKRMTWHFVYCDDTWYASPIFVV